MYFDYSIRKTVLFVAIMVTLLFAVYLTFTAKNDRYGMTRFDKVALWEGWAGKERIRYLFTKPSKSLAAAGATGIDSGSSARAVPVLLYHGVLDTSDDEYTFPRKKFEEQIMALKKAGWETITLKEYQEFIRGERSLPERSLLLTFDDGAKNTFYGADPLLEALNYNAVLFILHLYSANEGTTYYLSAGEIERMMETGRWEIQSHATEAHLYKPITADGTEGPSLGNLLWKADEGRLETPEEFEDRVRNDLSLAKYTLEKRFGNPITALAYPFGEYGHLSQNYPLAEEVIRRITFSIYDDAFYQWWPGEGYRFNYPNLTVPMSRRIEPKPSITGDELVAALEAGIPKPLPYDDPLNSENTWLTLWGTRTFENGRMTLKPLEAQTGAMAIIDGTADWHDYRVDATLTSPQDTGFSLLVRYNDANNYVFCNFGIGFVHAEEVVDGNRRVIKGYRAPDVAPLGTLKASATVQGRTIGCSLNDELIVETPFLDRSLTMGGVGAKSWDAEPEKTSLIIERFAVTPLPRSDASEDS